MRALRRIRQSLGSNGIQAGGYENSRRLAKWLPIGFAIGLVAGGGAILFTKAIQLVTHFALQAATGFQPPGPVGEGGGSLVPALRAWALPLVTTLGGILSGLIVFGLAPEAEGHGTDAAIEAFHRRGGWIRARIPPIKLLASAITIGTGGSAGREGPAAQISAGFGSLLGHAVLKNPADRRIAVAAGIGAGIGAIFRAPLGGALLAAEILYVHDMEVEAIVPSLIASIVGYTLYGSVVGYAPIFGAHPTLELGSPLQLAYYAVLGAVAGGGGLLYAKTFYGMTEVFHRIPVPRWARPGLGGLGVGLLGLGIPQVLHTGYGWVQIVMTRESLLAVPTLFLVAIPFAKILATALSIGSGGSGGIFGPGMVVGAMLGAALWSLGMALGLPGMPDQPAAFVIIGMMALFGGIAHAPLAVMLMVAEMTGTLSLLAPAMIAVAISTAVVGDETIYRAQLRDRFSSPVLPRPARRSRACHGADRRSEGAPASRPLGEGLGRGCARADAADGCRRRRGGGWNRACGGERQPRVPGARRAGGAHHPDLRCRSACRASCGPVARGRDPPAGRGWNGYGTGRGWYDRHRARHLEEHPAGLPGRRSERGLEDGLPCRGMTWKSEGSGG